MNTLTAKSQARDQMYNWKSYRDLLRLLSSAILGFTLAHWLMVYLEMPDKRPAAIFFTVVLAIAVTLTFLAWRRLVYYRKRFEAIAPTSEYVEELFRS